MKIQELLQQKLGKSVDTASNTEIYYALLSIVQEMAKEKEAPEQQLEEKMERWMYLEDLAARIAEQ